MSKPSRGQHYGQYLARKMANHKPLTKQQMLRKWKTLGSVYNIERGIDWIEANTSTSDNPFLFVWDNGSPSWGFRDTFGIVRVNLLWNLQYLMTRMQTTQTVLDHAIASPVVAMTQTERRIAKSISAQAGGTVAFIDSMIHAI